MRKKLTLAKRIHVWWIVLRETRKLAFMSTMPIRDMEAYAEKQDVPQHIKELTLAALVELSFGRKPYESIHAIIDAAIEARIPEFRALSLGLKTPCLEASRARAITVAPAFERQV